VKFFQSNKLSKIFWFFFAASASEKMTHWRFSGLILIYTYIYTYTYIWALRYVLFRQDICILKLPLRKDDRKNREAFHVKYFQRFQLGLLEKVLPCIGFSLSFSAKPYVSWHSRTFNVSFVCLTRSLKISSIKIKVLFIKWSMCDVNYTFIYLDYTYECA
jgi:hypothetical protein